MDGLDGLINFKKGRNVCIFYAWISEDELFYLTDLKWCVLMLYFRCLQSAENADPQFNLEYRGPVTMKGKKEPMKVWFLSRKPTDLVAHS